MGGIGRIGIAREGREKIETLEKSETLEKLEILEELETLVKSGILETGELSLEGAFELIEETIGCLEEDDITLEESFQTYQAGMKLLQYCNEKIDKVEKQVLKINEDGELDEF